MTNLQSTIQRLSQRLHPQIRPDTPDSVTLLQWNVQGMRSWEKQNYVIATTKNHNPDILLIQETNLRPEEQFTIPGYIIYNKPGPRGLAIAIKNCIPHRLAPALHLGLNVETQGIDISTASKTIRIVNVYRNPTPHRNARLDFSLFPTWSRNLSCIIAGDLNAHHPLWRSDPSHPACPTGLTIADALQTNNLVILNSGENTHINGGSLDLTIVTADLAQCSAWSVEHSVVSDHYGISIVLQLAQLPDEPTPQHRNYKKANWKLYSETLENSFQLDHLPLNIDELNQKIVDHMNISADQTIPSTSKLIPRKEAWYYTDRVKELKNRINQHTRLVKRHPTPANKAKLQEVKNHAKAVFSQERTSKWLNWCNSLNCHTTVSAMWKQIRTASGKFTPTPRHPDPLTKANALNHDFAARGNTSNLSQNTRDTLLQDQPQHLHNIDIALATPHPSLDRPYTPYELQRATKSKSTTPGADNITHSMISNAGPTTQTAILQLINNSHATRTIPNSWKKADIIPVPKLGKDNAFRPIALTSCLCKLTERMLLNRITWEIGSLHPNIFGFCPGKSTADAFTSVLHSATKLGRSPSYIVFIDLEKAFELANPSLVLSLLADKGITGSSLAWVRNFMEHRSIRVKYQQKTSDYLPIENGTPQGSVISPFLFNLLMDKIVTSQLPPCVNAYSYADDLAFIATGPNALKNIHITMNIISQKTQQLGLKISPEKSKAMALHAPDPPDSIILSGCPLKWVSSHTYLGIIIDKCLTLRPHIDYLEQRMFKRLNIMRSLTSPTIGATSTVLQKYYTSSVRSLIDYSSPALIIAKTALHQRLNKLQNIAMRTILGAPPWTNILTMQTECHLISIPARIRQITASYLTKIITDPAAHNMSSNIMNTQIQNIQLLNLPPSWLREALHILAAFIPDYHLAADIPIEPPPPPWTFLPATFHINLPTTAKKLANPHQLKTDALHRISMLNKDKDTIIFTDGSVDQNTGRTGAGIVFMSPAQVTLHKSRRLPDSCSTLQTELAAISIALTLAISYHRQNIIIHTDSLASLQSLQSHWPSDNRNLITSAKKLCHIIFESGGTVTFHWIPSHVDIVHNDVADSLAKTATTLPTVDIRSIRRSRSQLKNIIYHKSRLLQNNIIHTAQPQSRSLRWLQSVTSFKPLKISHTCSRTVQTRISRLRLGYRCSFEICRTQATNCNHCHLGTAEPLLHYILECPVTSPVFGNPLSTQHHDSATVAAQRLKFVLNNPRTISHLLVSFAPPR